MVELGELSLSRANAITARVDMSDLFDGTDHSVVIELDFESFDSPKLKAFGIQRRLTQHRERLIGTAPKPIAGSESLDAGRTREYSGRHPKNSKR